MVKKFMRRKASRQQGRQGLWFRHGLFNLSSMAPIEGIFGNTVVYPELWERDNVSIINQKRKGGAVLSSLFGNVCIQWNYDSNDLDWSPSMELLIYVDAVDADEITDTNTFYQKMDSKRVLHYSATFPQVHGAIATNASISDEAVCSITKSFNLKTKVALSDKTVRMVTRTGLNSGVSDMNSFTTRGSASGYITTP